MEEGRKRDASRDFRKPENHLRNRNFITSDPVFAQRLFDFQLREYFSECVHFTVVHYNNGNVIISIAHVNDLIKMKINATARFGNGYLITYQNN